MFVLSIVFLIYIFGFFLIGLPIGFLSYRTWLQGPYANQIFVRLFYPVVSFGFEPGSDWRYDINNCPRAALHFLPDICDIESEDPDAKKAFVIVKAFLWPIQLLWSISTILFLSIFPRHVLYDEPRRKHLRTPA